MAQIAVDADALRRDDEEVGGRRPLLLGAVLRVGADVDDLLRPAVLVDVRVARRQEVVEVADDGAEVLAGGDGPQPPMEWKRTAMAPSGSSDGVSSDFTS